MNYIQIKVPVPENSDISEILIAQLSSIGFESFEEQTDSLVAFIPEIEFVKDDLLTVDYFLESEKSGTLNIELLPDKNWNEVWESNYPSVTIADRCYVRAPFHDSKPSIEYEIVIHPKMAFGTAHHETTAMMIRLILENDFTNKKVLDMGCGTGVLAILASMKGAKSITAIDNDKWSFSNTLENAELNNISNVQVIEGDACNLKVSDDFEIILANINKNILLRDMKYYAAALIEGGYIYFSGFYADDLHDITIEARKCGLQYINNLENSNWVASAFLKLNS
jgi:ribosomal protein L11 methyltransferase